MTSLLSRGTAHPTLVLLLAGIVLGPHGLALLTPGILALLDPAIPVALAALGVVAGLHLRVDAPVRRQFAATQIQSIVTGVLVGTGIWLIGPIAFGDRQIESWWIVTLTLAIAAATSDVDDFVVAIVAGGIALALVRAPDDAVHLLFQAAAITLVIAISGWMLLSHAIAAEQRVFAFGALLLLGGAADYVSASSLLAGFLAGSCWRHADGAVRESIRRDVVYVQHPLVVLVLLVSGAAADFTPAALLLGVTYILVRTSGKLAGAWLASTSVAKLSNVSRLQLLSPGIFGVAFALNVMRAGGPDFTPVLTAVVIGTIVSSFVSALTAAEEPA